MEIKAEIIIVIAIAINTICGFITFLFVALELCQFRMKELFLI